MTQQFYSEPIDYSSHVISFNLTVYCRFIGNDTSQGHMTVNNGLLLWHCLQLRSDTEPISHQPETWYKPNRIHLPQSVSQTPPSNSWDNEYWCTHWLPSHPIEQCPTQLYPTLYDERRSYSDGRTGLKPQYVRRTTRHILLCVGCCVDLSTSLYWEYHTILLSWSSFTYSSYNP